MKRFIYLSVFIILFISFFSNYIFAKNIYGTLDLGLAFKTYKDDYRHLKVNESGLFGFSIMHQISEQLSWGTFFNGTGNYISSGITLKYDLFNFYGNIQNKIDATQILFAHYSISYDRKQGIFNKDNIGIKAGFGIRFGSSKSGIAEFKPNFHYLINFDGRTTFKFFSLQLSIIL